MAETPTNSFGLNVQAAIRAGLFLRSEEAKVNIPLSKVDEFIHLNLLINLLATKQVLVVEPPVAQPQPQ